MKFWPSPRRGKQPEIGAQTVAANPTNRPPVISRLTASAQSVSIGEPVQFSAQASDPDGDSLTYYWTVLNGTFNSCTGTCSSITWTAPSVSRSRTFEIHLEVGDKKGRVAFLTQTISVQIDSNGNTDSIAPFVTMSEPGGITYTEGDSVVVRWSASDVGGISHFVLDKFLTNTQQWDTVSSYINGSMTSISWTAELGVSKLRIWAFDEAGNYAVSESESFVVDANECPEAPATPRIIDPGISTPNDFIVIQWYGVDCADEYLLSVAKDYAYANQVEYVVTDDEYTFNNLENGTYYFKVRARNEHGRSAWSSLVSIRVAKNHNPLAASGPYPSLGARNVPRANLELSWDIEDDPDGDPVTSAPYLGTSPNSMTRLRPFNDETFYTISELEACTGYYWRVVTRDTRGGEETSPTWGFTTECTQADVSVQSIHVEGDIRFNNEVTASVVLKNLGGYGSLTGTLKLYASTAAGNPGNALSWCGNDGSGIESRTIHHHRAYFHPEPLLGRHLLL